MPLKRFIRASAIRQFLYGQSSAGLMLLASAALALVHANSPLGPGYAAMLQFHLGPLSIEHWINDGLMSVFFLLVGLEFKREMLDGQLSTGQGESYPAGLPQVAWLPQGACLAPALIYLGLTAAPPLLAGRYGGATQRAK